MVTIKNAHIANLDLNVGLEGNMAYIRVTEECAKEQVQLFMEDFDIESFVWDISESVRRYGRYSGYIRGLYTEALIKEMRENLVIRCNKPCEECDRRFICWTQRNR